MKNLNITYYSLVIFFFMSGISGLQAGSYIDLSVEEGTFFNKNLPEREESMFLVSHARPGELFLEGEWMGFSQITQWFETNQLLEGKSKLYILGCEFGKGDKGKSAVNYLSQYFDISVSASDDITGIDGDWNLEIGQPIELPVLPYFYNLQFADAEDLDGDGIDNVDDTDDDNDGIPDSDEGFVCEETTNTFTFKTQSENIPEQNTIYCGDKKNSYTYFYDAYFETQNDILGTYNAIWSYSGLEVGKEANFQYLFQFSNVNGSHGVDGDGNRNNDDARLETWIYLNNTLVSNHKTNFGDPDNTNKTREFVFTPTSSSGTLKIQISFQRYNGYCDVIPEVNFRPYRINQTSGIECTILDSDEDDIPDHQDTDSDNDGCPDAIEGSGSYADSDLDGEGRLSGDVNAGGVPTVAGTGQAIGDSRIKGPDQDDDGISDSCDPDPNDPCVNTYTTAQEYQQAIDNGATGLATADCDGDGTPNNKDDEPLDPCVDYSVGSENAANPEWAGADCDGDGTPNGEDDNPYDPCVDYTVGSEDSSNPVWAGSDCDGDGVPNGKEDTPGDPGDEPTDPYDECDYNAEDITLSVTSEKACFMDYGDLDEVTYGLARNENYLDSDGDGIPDMDKAVWAGNQINYESGTNTTGDSYNDGLIGIPEKINKKSFTLDIALSSYISKTVYYGLWIDWNGDGNFDSFYSGSDMTVTRSATTKVEETIEVPDSYVSENVVYRLRVSDQLLSESDYEGALSNGETEDYQKQLLLPINMNSFEALRKEGFVELNWSTLSENNSDYFEVQRSPDGTNFQTIDQINAAGKSTSQLDYTYKDERPIEGINFYRVILNNQEGAPEYTGVKKVEMDREKLFGDLRIYPNPGHEYIDIDMGSVVRGRDQYSVEIYNSVGMRIVDRSVSGKTRILMNSNIPGMYIIKIKDAQGKVLDTRKWLKVE